MVGIDAFDQEDVPFAVPPAQGQEGLVLGRAVPAPGALEVPERDDDEVALEGSLEHLRLAAMNDEAAAVRPERGVDALEIGDDIGTHLDLAKMPDGIGGQAKILKREVVGSWEALIAYCRTCMAHRETEQFRVLFLDSKNVVIADEALSSGTVAHVPVYPREVAKRALELNASAVILIHNHPSGDPTPSTEDIEMTFQIASACEAIEVRVHDHIVIGREAEVSFRASGFM
jgi:DNA repair protein RadC